jgi:hypothetical protein
VSSCRNNSADRRGGTHVLRPRHEVADSSSINHILGRVLLTKAFIRGSMSPTIPSQFARYKQLSFSMDTPIVTEWRARCSCSTCIYGNSGDRNHGQCPSRKVRPERKIGGRRQVGREHYVSLIRRREQHDDNASCKGKCCLVLGNLPLAPTSLLSIHFRHFTFTVSESI